MSPQYGASSGCIWRR